MWRADTPSVSDATLVRLIPASYKTLSRRCTARVRSSVMLLR